MAAIALGACGGDDWEDQPISGYESDGDSIVVGGGCHPDARATAIETGDRIEVTMEVKGERLGDCYGTAVVDLEQPVGDRTVVDALTGDEVPVVQE